jgi:hypothetical protein
MTGAPATASSQVGGEFTAHGDYISGINLELVDGERVLQTWRTIQFEDSDRDSLIEVTFEVSSTGTLVTLRHWNIPPDQAEGYESGWPNFDFASMQDFFGFQRRVAIPAALRTEIRLRCDPPPEPLP